MARPACMGRIRPLVPLRGSYPPPRLQLNKKTATPPSQTLRVQQPLTDHAATTAASHLTEAGPWFEEPPPLCSDFCRLQTIAE